MQNKNSKKALTNKTTRNVAIQTIFLQDMVETNIISIPQDPNIKLKSVADWMEDLNTTRGSSSQVMNDYTKKLNNTKEPVGNRVAAGLYGWLVQGLIDLGKMDAKEEYDL